MDNPSSPSTREVVKPTEPRVVSLWLRDGLLHVFHNVRKGIRVIWNVKKQDTPNILQTW